MIGLRTAELAREHGLSTQAVRNYEQSGFIPPAERTPSDYRVYTDLHASALRAFLALIPAHGHGTAGQIMTAIHDGELDWALTLLDRSHHQLLRDRETLNSVRKAIDHLATQPAPAADGNSLTVGELAHRLGVTPATLRNWEETGILTPARDRGTGYRRYQPLDIRDAELTHLLRRGGYPLERIATVVRQIREAGGTEAVAAALADWQQRLTARGLAMLSAAGKLSEYLRRRDSA